MIIRSGYCFLLEFEYFILGVYIWFVCVFFQEEKDAYLPRVVQSLFHSPGGKYRQTKSLAGRVGSHLLVPINYSVVYLVIHTDSHKYCS